MHTIDIYSIFSILSPNRNGNFIWLLYSNIIFYHPIEANAIVDPGYKYTLVTLYIVHIDIIIESKKHLLHSQFTVKYETTK